MKDLGQKFRENTQNVEFANIGLSVMKMQKMLGKLQVFLNNVNEQKKKYVIILTALVPLIEVLMLSNNNVFDMWQ